MRRVRVLSALVFLTGAVLLVLAATMIAEPRAASLPDAPAGLTAIALDGAVSLSWQPVDGASEYVVYRGTSLADIERVTPVGHASTTFTDQSAANGGRYYYAVRAVSPEGQSAVGAQLAEARPQARSCSSTNPLMLENCFPGTTAWKSIRGTRAYEGGIEGFASASSVQAGGSVDLRIEAAPDAPYHVEIYRTGYYGGEQGRLVSVINGLRGRAQAPCLREEDTTGIVDCSNWATVASLSTSSDWPSGVYLLKLVREDNGLYNEIPLVVRSDGSHSDVVFHVPTSTYQAYNNFYGKGLYDGMSALPNTVSGATRAVQVSFDRPYAQPTAGPERYDWYTRTDLATVSWLERQGYDMTYIASEDMHAAGARLRDHRVFVSGSHDEYWSQEMFDAAMTARNAGTSLVFLGANAAYWKVRFDKGRSGVRDRSEITYKTVQGGPVDPSGASTSTWRDPAGPNRPENELIGQMYVGENIGNHFPLRVSSEEGRHRFWRYTPLGTLAAGTTASIGTALVGWEWDARVANGREPAGVATLASSPVNGALLQGNGQSQASGTTIANATIYRAASGARVFASGTNNWWRGLARNVYGSGEPDGQIQQATVNVLADMGVRPAQPESGLRLDSLAAPAVTATDPPANATGAQPTTAVSATFDAPLDPGTIEDSDYTLTGPDGASVDARVSFDSEARRLVLRPAETLEPFTSYTARIGTEIATWAGTPPTQAMTWSFSTGIGTPPTVVASSPAAGSTAVATDTSVTARFDRRLDAATVSTETVSLRPPGGQPVEAQVTYDDPTRTVRLRPLARLQQSTGYTAEFTAALAARDGRTMSTPVSFGFTTGTNVQVSSRTPAPLAGGISPVAVARAVFSRPVDPSTLSADGFTLMGPGDVRVPASVSYDAATRTATLTPDGPLSLMTTYSARVDDAVRGVDGAPLDGSTWTFSTAITAPPAPAVTSLVPSAEASGVANSTVVRAGFDRALDAVTVTPQSVTLAPDVGPAVAATVAYDASSHQVTLTPLAALAVGTRYTARLTTAVRSTTGAPLAALTAWAFTTTECPCSLMTSQRPDQVGLPVRDFRPGPGPFSYELGTRMTTDEPSDLVAVRFYKDAGESGAHVGRVWSETGTELARVHFEHETASGWQRQALPQALRLDPGRSYTVSVGLNDFYVKTQDGLSQQLVSGPLRSVPTANGRYAEVAGQFPQSSWRSSNYFVDGVVRLPGRAARTPQIVSTTPMAAATGVGVGEVVVATLTVPLDPSTVSSETFTLVDQGGDPVAGQVLYDDDARTVTFRPAGALDMGAAYTARLGTGIRSDDETPLEAPVEWSFATVPPDPPALVNASPAAGGVDVSPHTTVKATFSEPMEPASLNSAFVLTAPGGARVPAGVSYDAPSRTATLTPTAPLAASTAYTAEVGTAALGARGIAMEHPEAWGFTTSDCPCRLFEGEPQPDVGGLDTRNYRSGAGPWSLELGVKVQVTQAARLEAVRYYRDPGETGTHDAHVWTAQGALVAVVPFGPETASGWQEQELPAPVQLTPGATYVVSVGLNSRFGMTDMGLADEITSGSLRSVAGANGVYADAAGVFPTLSWRSSNYYVDAVVR
jgi:Domain of unknown function (DUF4082)/Bacterial Ig-like domain